MKQYRESLGDVGFQLDATIELLECTTVFIRNFRDSRPITDVSDERLKQNSDAINWFINWENKVKRDTNIR
jgi:low affinity Fe/Cu permease